jgi:hypothetical protein
MATSQPELMQVAVALQNTYSPVEQQRKDAEGLLRQFEKVNGYAVTLLQVASSDADIAVRQASSIYLKNYVKMRWDSKEDTIIGDDKNTIKDNIIDVLIRVPPKVRIQIAATIADISHTDFPEKWPSFLPKIASLITSQNPAFMLGAILSLHKVLKKYQYMRSEDERKPLYELVPQVFPTLLHLLSALIPLDTADAGEMMKLICKTFEAAIKMGIPPYLTDPAIQASWINMFIQILERPIPEAILPKDVDERSKHPLWKVKKWVSRIMERFIKRYGNCNNETDSPANRQFGRAFINTYAIRVMGSMLQLLAIRRGGAGFLPDRLAQSLIAYITACLRHGVTYVALKPHLAAFTQGILFPYLWLSDKDMELWQDDPHEYLRKETELMLY